MPLLTIWCSFIPPNLEATSITLFTGLLNFSGNLSNYFGAFLSFILNVTKEHLEKLYILLII